MKKQIILLFTLLLSCAFLTSLKAQGSGNAVLAKQISAEEAAKKYPLAAGKSYPKGIRTEGSEKAGFYRSPYNSKVFDCRKIPVGGLVLDSLRQ